MIKYTFCKHWAEIEHSKFYITFEMKLSKCDNLNFTLYFPNFSKFVLINIAKMPTCGHFFLIDNSDKLNICYKCSVLYINCHNEIP